MRALLLAWFCAGCALAAPPVVECALVVPRPQGLDLGANTLHHDAEHGVTVVPGIAPEMLAELFDGTMARFVVAGAAELGRERARVRLPLDAGELTYLAFRDGRPAQMTVASPAAVTVELAAPAAERQAVRLAFETVQPTAPEQLPQLRDQRAGEPAFAAQRVELSWSLPPGEPLLVLLEAPLQRLGGARQPDVAFRNRIGAQTFEASAPLLGVVLRRVPDGGRRLFDQVQPPLAPPGYVRVRGQVPDPRTLPYRFDLTLGEALTSAGVAQPEGGAVWSRQGDEGGVERRYVELRGSTLDQSLSDRDDVTVVGADSAPRPARPAAEAPAPLPAARQGPAGMPEPARAPRPQGPQGPAGPMAAPGGAAGTAPPGEAANHYDLSQRGAPTGSLLLEELDRVAPAAARAAAASVALRGRVRRDGRVAEVLLCGTIVSPDGLVVTAPGSALEGVEDLVAQLSDGRELACERVTGMPAGPLVALRLPAAGLPALSPDGAPLPAPGSPLVVLGHPYGLIRSVTLTVVGGPRRALPQAPGAELQLDGALAAGNSGGPVVDLNGRLVGIAYGTLRPEEPGPAVSLAVPAEQVAAFVRSLPGR